MEQFDTPPRAGLESLPPDELILAGLAIRQSAMEKLTSLGLTEEEVLSLISIDISIQ